MVLMIEETVVVPPGGRILYNEYVERSGPPKIVYAGMVSYRKHVDLFVNSMRFGQVYLERMLNSILLKKETC